MAEKEVIIRSKIDVSDAEKSVDKLSKSIDSLDKNTEIKGASMTKTLKAVTTSAQGLTGAFTAVSSAVILMNGNNEEMAKTLTKLMAIQNISNGIYQVANSLTEENNILTIAKNAYTVTATTIQKAYTFVISATTGAMKALRIAMIALPIAAVIAGVTLLVGLFKKLVGNTDELTEANKRLTKAYDLQIERMQDTAKWREKDLARELEIAELVGESEENLNKLRVKLLNEREANRQKELDAQIAMMQKLEEQWTASLKTRDKKLQESLKLQMDASTARVEELIAMEEDLNHALIVEDLKYKNKLAKEQETAENERLQKQREWADKRRAEKEAQQQKLLEIERIFEDLLISNITDDNARRETEILTRFEREKAMITEKYGEQTEVIKQLELQRDAELNELRASMELEQVAKDDAQKELEFINRQAELEAHLLAIRDDWEAEQALKLELAELERDWLLTNDELTAGERLLINERYNQALLDNAERRQQQEIALEKAKSDAIKNVTGALLSATLDNLEEGTNAYKAIAITQTTISTIQSAIEAFKSLAGIPIVGTALGAAAAVAVTASGIASIRKIAQTSVSAKSSSSPSMPTAPRVNTGGFGGAGSIESGVTDQGGVMTNEDKDTGVAQVVILQSEIEMNQKKSNQVNVLSKG